MAKLNSPPLTAEDRARHVAQANANQAIEGLTPSAEDKEIQQRYIDGTASIEDLLKHANDFLEKAKGK